MHGFETDRIKKQLNIYRLFYPVFMLEKEVEWWSLPSALTIYCYCLHRLIVSLNFVSTKRDNYLLTLNCTEAHVQCNLRQITFKIFWLTFKKCFIMLYELMKKG